MANKIVLINSSTNICENITLDERNASDIFVNGFIVRDFNEIGGGRIGDLWDGVKLSPPPDPVTVKVPTNITRRQCALQLLAMNMATPQEALDMTKNATVPLAISNIFEGFVSNGSWTADQKILAEIDFAAVNYYRDNQLLSLMGLTEEEIDQFFIEAEKL